MIITNSLFFIFHSLIQLLAGRAVYVHLQKHKMVLEFFVFELWSKAINYKILFFIIIRKLNYVLGGK